MDFYPDTKEKASPGIMVGKVVANYDEKHKGMVRVAYHSHDGKGNTADWMRVAAVRAGKNKGVFFLPEIGEDVLVAFINNDINNPCVIGSLWNDENSFPDGVVTSENTVKTILTRSGAKLVFNDEQGKESIAVTTPKGVKVIMTDESDTITIGVKKEGNVIKIDGSSGDVTISGSNKITLKAKDIELKAEGNIVLNSQKINLSAKGDFTAEGMKTEIKAKSQAKISSSGITEIKGNMVKLNG